MNQRDISRSQWMRSRRIRHWVYFMQLATPVFHATWISRVSHAAAFSLHCCRSADYQIAPDKRVPPRRVYTYIRGTFVLPRNGIIVGTYRWHAILRLCRMRPFAATIHACNSSLIAAVELLRSQKKLILASRIQNSLLTLAIMCKRYYTVTKNRWKNRN